MCSVFGGLDYHIMLSVNVQINNKSVKFLNNNSSITPDPSCCPSRNKISTHWINPSARNPPVETQPIPQAHAKKYSKASAKTQRLLIGTSNPSTSNPTLPSGKSNSNKPSTSSRRKITSKLNKSSCLLKISILWPNYARIN